MKTVKELQEFFDKNKATIRYKELSEYVEKNLVKAPIDFEDLYKQFEQFERELADKNFTDTEFEEYRQELFQGFYDFHMAIIEMGIINILQHEPYPMELRTIMAEIYRIDTVNLLNQVIEKRDWGVNFFSLLSAYKPLFEKMVMDWGKGKIVHFVLRVNSEPTDELHQSVIRDQFEVESELLINSKNPLLSFYHERLTKLMDNLDKRSAIAGGFDKAETGKWDNLYIDLKNAKYINTTIGVFNSVMEYKHLPGGANKIQWLTSKADAVCFQENFKFSIPEFNECFYKDKYPFQQGSSVPIEGRKKTLKDIITRHKE